jgi:hypothetical protein
MQIWFLDPSPVKSAEILYEKSPVRARKYVVEFMQATAYLCEQHKLLLPIKKDGIRYKTKLASRFPKPLMEWLNTKIQHYKWAYNMAYHICVLDKKPSNVLTPYNQDRCHALSLKLPINTLRPSPPANYAKSKAKGLDFTHLPVHQAYNLYLDVQLT